MITTARLNDVARLAEMFWNNIKNAPAYISHGEIQMGIAEGVGQLAADGYEKWIGYITDKIENKRSTVLLSEENDELAGFIVLEIDSDNDKPFGVICDLLTAPETRGKGIGSLLLKSGMEWLRQNGIHDFYLESGVNNHRAHEFFERHGFKMVSHIFKWEK